MPHRNGVTFLTLEEAEGLLCMKINQFEFYGCACVSMD
jgi:hypothetical protein